MQGLERARRKLLFDWARQLRPYALARFGLMPAGQLAREIVRGCAGTSYRRDSSDSQARGAEVVKHPIAVLRGAGGDCEDQNLFLAGALFAACAPGTRLGSVYLPSVKKAQHVRLAFHDGNEWRVLDLVGRSFTGPWEEGELMPW